MPDSSRAISEDHGFGRDRRSLLTVSALVVTCFGALCLSGCNSEVHPSDEREFTGPVRPEPGLQPLGQTVYAFPGAPIVVPARRTGRELAGWDAVPVRRADGDRTSRAAAGVHWLSALPRQGDALGGSFIWAEEPNEYLDHTGATIPDVAVPFYIAPPFHELSHGDLVVDEETVEIRWLESPQALVSGATAEWMTGPRLSWPDPRSPIEAFRRTLLVEHTDLGAVDLSARGGEGHDNGDGRGGEDRLITSLARYNVLIWRAGLDALNAISPGVHDALVETLIRRCGDGAIEFAAWPSDRLRLRELEELLVEMAYDPRGELQARYVMAWIERHPDAVAWIESDHGDHVRLAVANLSHRPHALGISWVGIGGPDSPMVVPPFSIGRTTVPRPSLAPVEALRLDGPNRQWTIATGPASILVSPPGLTLRSFSETWRLETWLAEQPAEAPDEVATRVTVRRSAGRWELFVEMNSTAAAPSPDAAAEPANIDDDNDNDDVGLWDRDRLERLAGLDAITLFFGPADYPDGVLTVTRGGQSREWIGNEDLATCSISISEGDDGEDGGWIARIGLPVGWNQLAMIDVGFLRTCRERPVGYSSPRPCLPWRIDPGRYRLNLTRWRSFPGAAG